MVAAVVAPLDHRRAAELAAPDDQRVVEQPAPLQVLDQGRTGPVGLPAFGLQALRPGRRGGPTPRGRSARSGRRARPAGGPAGNCWRTRSCPARRRTGPASPSIPGEMSISSGALDCMRYAISNELIRVAISGSPTTPQPLFVQAADGVERVALGLHRRTRAGWRDRGPGRRCSGTGRPGRPRGGSRSPSSMRRRWCPSCRC